MVLDSWSHSLSSNAHLPNLYTRHPLGLGRFDPFPINRSSFLPATQSLPVPHTTHTCLFSLPIDFVPKPRKKVGGKARYMDKGKSLRQSRVRPAQVCNLSISPLLRYGDQSRLRGGGWGRGSDLFLRWKRCTRSKGLSFALDLSLGGVASRYHPDPFVGGRGETGTLDPLLFPIQFLLSLLFSFSKDP